MHISSTCIFKPGVGPWTNQGNMLGIQGDRLYCPPMAWGVWFRTIFQVKRKGAWILDSSYLIPVFVSRTWIMDCNQEWDSRFYELYSSFQNPGFLTPYSETQVRLYGAKYCPCWLGIVTKTPHEYIWVTYDYIQVHTDDIRIHRSTYG